MTKNENKQLIYIYGWITKQEPLVIVIGCEEQKIKSCEEQVKAQAGRKVMFFKYNQISISFPEESFSGYTQEHGNQISQFVKLILNTKNLIPNCIFNDGSIKIIKNAHILD